MYRPRLCPCGSGKSSWWLRDARGIECCRICENCEAEKKKRYRPEIFEDPAYECDEDVDPEEGPPGMDW